ncbi:hypothetical protein APED_29710 [Acanthopleuribacter pedis]
MISLHSFGFIIEEEIASFLKVNRYISKIIGEKKTKTREVKPSYRGPILTSILAGLQNEAHTLHNGRAAHLIRGEPDREFDDHLGGPGSVAFRRRDAATHGPDRVTTVVQPLAAMPRLGGKTVAEHF